MEGNLKVTPEQLESASNEFSAKGTTVGNLTTQMMELVTGLAGVWEGEAATAFMNKFRELEDDIQKIIRMIQEHATDLTEMAKVYRDAETAGQDEINSLPGDVIV